MRKIRKRTFAELVMENKRQLLNDPESVTKHLYNGRKPLIR
ncbi:FbpB family small basic protein [Anoxybacillus flavithermus]|nr:FbpB family small basic protein [Anoxybacillus flavithermus]MBE2935995.1 FbpB family small basic protein [Anoxybacillus flavithermus]